MPCAPTPLSSADYEVAIYYVLRRSGRRDLAPAAMKKDDRLAALAQVEINGEPLT
jgi:hypothetical protein